MTIGITVGLKGHDVPLSFRIDRRVAFQWVSEYAAEIMWLEVDCGLNRWSWTPLAGWTQFSQCAYTPGKGVRHMTIKPIQHGNYYDSRHPWRFCMEDSLTPNPLSYITEDSLF